MESQGLNYYQRNKEKILEKAKQIINCECGISYQISGKSNHLKSKKHISYKIN